MADGSLVAGIYRDGKQGIAGQEEASGLARFEVMAWDKTPDHTRSTVYYQADN